MERGSKECGGEGMKGRTDRGAVGKRDRRKKMVRVERKGKREVRVSTWGRGEGEGGGKGEGEM